ncbi:MFS transporter, DHA1 family, multidrug resistance protein [Pseudohyphozyma bogoriensis]|nr:MFS transporter, DHA1 family, multidrug resistance protein [Pseudohyphozyma bogoriensis]
MKDILRDSTVGQFLNYVSKGRILPYADQRADYVVPSRYLLTGSNVVDVGASTPNSDRTLSTNPTADAVTLVDAAGVAAKNTADLEKGDQLAEAKLNNLPAVVEDPYLVTWEGPNDPDNPRNWSKNKRVFVGFLISFLTFSVYIGSAIYTSAIPSLMADFGVSQTKATWGLTLFVLAYGIGPMFLAPIQEMAAFGRNPAYIGGLFLFVLFQVPAIFAKNISTILAFRFLAGFVGSPALATGGASMGDIFPPMAMPYAIGTWAIGAVCGPVLGPAIGGFAAQANGWRWPFYILLWISGFALILLSLFLPETLDATILLRRAQRLRKLTGNPHLRSQSEIDAAEGQTLLQVAMHNFVMAFRLSVEPAIGFANVYIGLIYAIFYLWFEAFPLVFTDVYHFNLGLSGLPFLGFVVSGAITFFFYVIYNKVHMEPRYMKNADIQPEVRLELAIVASIFIPISLFLFGWSSKASVHWIVPIIGAALYLPGIYLNFQSILMYLAMGYPTQAVPIFAGNDLFRSTIASFFPLFGRAFFDHLGLGGGSSLLAGLSILMIPVLYALMKFGARLRARSKWTN